MPIKFDYISDVKMIFPDSIIIEIRGQYAYVHNDDAIFISKVLKARLNEGKIPYIWLYENQLEKYILSKLRSRSISYIIVRDGSIISSSFFHAPYSNALNMYRASFSKAAKPKPQPAEPIASKQKDEPKPVVNDENKEPSENKSKTRSYFKEPSIPEDESKKVDQLNFDTPSAKVKKKESSSWIHGIETLKSEEERKKEIESRRFAARIQYSETPPKEKECKNCKLFRRGECFGEKEICEHYDVAPGSFNIFSY